MKKLLFIIGLISSATLAIGVTFKLLHIEGANALFIAGLLILLLIFIPVFSFEKYRTVDAKKSYERLKIIFGATAAVIVGISGLFKLMHLMGADILLLFGAFIFIAGFLPIYFYSMYKKSIS